MLKRLRNVAAASVVVAAPVFTLLSPGMAHALTGTTYKWTGGGTDGVVSTAGDNDEKWSTPGNWVVSTDGGATYASGVPASAPVSTDNSGAGDNIVFDDGALTADEATTDDISGLKVQNISTIAASSGSFVYSVSGQGLTITGGIAGRAGQAVNMSNALTFAGDQTYGTTNGVAINPSGSMTVASGTLTAAVYMQGNALTVASGATLNITNGGSASTLAGSGAIVVVTPASGPYANSMSLYDSGSANTFSGTIDVQKGAILYASGNSPANALGAAALTIEDGGQLNLYVDPQPAAETGTVTLANAITMGGNGAGVDQMTQGAVMAGLYDQAKQETAGTLAVTFSGSVTLTSDTNLSSTYATATTYNFTGSLNKNGHVLGATTAAQPTYGTSTVQVNGATVAGGANAPGTPDTGFALASAHPVTTLLMTLVSALAIFGIARKTAAARR